MSEHDKLIQAATTFKAKVDAYRGAHFAASDHLRIGHYVLGIALILVSAVVSGTVLQASETNPSNILTLTTGILSIVVVVLTAIQTTFKLGERGEQHRSAAVGFGDTSRKLELFIDRPHPDISKAWDELVAIADGIKKTEEGSPGFLRRTYDDAAEDVHTSRLGTRTPSHA